MPREIGNGGRVGRALDTDDLRIKGFARSARRRAQDPQPAEARDVLPNSASVSHGGALGGSVTWDRGYVGVSYAGSEKRYGTVAEPDVTIDMRSDRLDLAGEVRELGTFITGVKFKAGHTDYRHTELDAGTPATQFINKGYDARLEAQHGRFLSQMTMPVTDSTGRDQPHDRDQNPPRQPEDAAGVQRKLRLHEDVGGGAFPRLPIAQVAAVGSVVVQPLVPHAARSVIGSRMEELHAVDTEAAVYGSPERAHV